MKPETKGSIMFRNIALIAIFCLTLTLTLYAERVVLNPSEQSGVTYTVVDATDDFTIIEININNYSIENITIGNEKYLDIGIDSAGVTLEKGFPSLPILAKSLIIGHDSHMSIDILKANYTEFAGQIVPSKGILYRDINPADIPYTFDEIYTQDTFYPSEIARLTDPYVMRELRGIAFQLLPVAVNPAQQTIRLYHQTTLKIYANGNDTDETVLSGPPSLITRDFIEIYKNHFLNYRFHETRYPPIIEAGTLLVICYPDFMAATQPYLDWKMQKGIPTTMIASNLVGTTAAQIKTYISTYYEENPTLAFIQFVGDHPQIPSLIYQNNGAADPNFGMLVGGASDYYPDVLIGRFSAQSIADVNTQVARTIHYERDLTTDDNWIPKAMGVASNEGPGHHGEYDHQHAALIRTALLAYGYETVDAIYQPSGTNAQINNALNAGRSYINYTGHGDTDYWVFPGYYNSNVNALTNTNMLPFVISVACNNGKFNASQVCFAEAWMRATDDDGLPTGAIATFMCSILQAWTPPMDTQDAIVDLLTGETKHTAGGLVYSGQGAMLDINNTASGREVMQTWNLFGDVTLVVRTKTPQDLAIQPSRLMMGATTYTVEVGEEDALVSIYIPEEETIVASGYTDGSGTVTLDVSSIATRNVPVLLTVTWFNGVTFVVELDRSLSVPYNENFEAEMGLTEMEWDTSLSTLSGIKPASGVGGSNGLTLNVNNDFATQYASTPSILGFDTQKTLTFEYRIVEYTSDWTLPLTAKTLGADDKVYIELSTTGQMGVYTLLQEINSTNHTPSTEFATLQMPVSSRYGQAAIKFRVVHGSGDWVAVIDNINIDAPSPAVFAIDRSSCVFPSTPMGETSHAQEFIVSNTGGAILNISAITLSGDNADQFSFEIIGSLPVAIAPNQTKVISVVFSPTELGDMTANLVITHNAPDSPSTVALSGTSTPSSDSDNAIVPHATALKANYPNPFNPSTTILFDVARSGHVSLDIYNTKGQKVICLVDENKPAGSHIVHWNGVDSSGHSVASGIYFYRMTADGYSSVKKMVLMK